MSPMAKAVEGAGSHPIPGFSYAGDAEVLGVLYVGLVHDSGSRVVMPADSVLSMGAAADQRRGGRGGR